VFDEQYASDFVSHDPRGDNDGTTAKRTIGAFQASMPDFNLTTEALLAEGDWTAGLFTIRGTFSNPFPTANGELPPTNKPIEITFTSFSHFNAEGKIAEDWQLFDYLNFLQQLGAIPA